MCIPKQLPSITKFASILEAKNPLLKDTECRAAETTLKMSKDASWKAVKKTALALRHSKKPL